MARGDFDRALRRALSELPPMLREALDNVAVVVEEWPPDWLLDELSATAPPAAPAVISGAPLDPFTIEVTWDAVAGAEGYLAWIMYGLYPATASWDKLGIVYDDGDPATPLAIQMKGLNVAKSYQIKVQAFNGAGYSADSATITVATPTDLPLAPENLQFVSATGTTIQMSWFDIADNETDFVIQRQPVPPISPFVTVVITPSMTPLGATGGNNWAVAAA